MTEGKRLPELNPIIHPQTRLQIMTALASLAKGDWISFTALQEMLQLTPGNLGAHIIKLEEAGYIQVDKEFVKRRPMTWLQITPKGWRAMRSYLEALKQYLE